MHDAQIVDQLDITLPAIQLSANLLGRLFNNLDGAQLCLCQIWHVRIARNVSTAEERSLDELAHGLALGEEHGRTEFQVGGCVSATESVTDFQPYRADIPLLEFERPLSLCHGLKNFRILLEKLIVDAPEGRYVLLATVVAATVVTNVHGQNVAGEPIVVKVHLGCDFGASKTDTLGPVGDLFVGRITNMTFSISLKRWIPENQSYLLSVWFA